MCIIIANIPNTSHIKKGKVNRDWWGLFVKLPSVCSVYLIQAPPLPPHHPSPITPSSCVKKWRHPGSLLPLGHTFVSVILRWGGGWGCCRDATTYMNTWVSTHNANTEGDQEHQHVWWAPTDNVSATFPWHCSCVTSLPQCHSSGVMMLCLGGGWNSVALMGWRGFSCRYLVFADELIN